MQTGGAKVFVNDTLVVDNWNDTVKGFGFFEHANEERIGAIHLEAGTEATIRVEWNRGDDIQLAGVRLGWLPPVDEDALLDEAVAAAAAAGAAVVVVGLDADWETESHDRPMFGLPGRQDELIARVSAANPNTVVVINAGSAIDMPWLDDVPAALLVWYPGQEFGNALADVLLGHVDPGGRMPVTFPKAVADGPTAALSQVALMRSSIIRKACLLVIGGMTSTRSSRWCRSATGFPTLNSASASRSSTAPPCRST
ncbi:MAG: glycoside hydrolase family 3 C-terminal domain-containing protein [Acidimicrobiales bacterium]